ncbi:hypothetical protein ACU8KH_06551 [Lachancea thermotolerans]
MIKPNSYINLSSNSPEDVFFMVCTSQNTNVNIAHRKILKL